MAINIESEMSLSFVAKLLVIYCVYQSLSDEGEE